MSSTLVNTVRIERTTRELKHLDAQVTAWIDRRKANDLLKQYDTPLTYLKDALCGSLCGLRKAVSQISPAEPADVVYQTCRAHDYRLVIVHRVWSWYRDKFEQRDADELKPVLAAADEVVWSCYAGPFRVAGERSDRIRRGPAPLPFVASRYAPEAIPRDEPPPDLQSDASDTIVHQYLEKLPIPVVGIPPTCLNDPWWLVYLGHEVGHHLQFDLLPDWALVNSFGKLLFQAAVTRPDPVLDTDNAEQWREWSREIFADACSVYAMGGWAVSAMAELERVDEASMLARNRPRYPPPAVRLDLLTRLAAHLGPTPVLPAGLDLDALTAGAPLVRGRVDLRAAAAEDRKMLVKIVDAIENWSLEDIGGFRTLFGWQPKELAGFLSNWTAVLLSDDKLFPDKDLPAARHLAAAAMAAWAKVAAIADPELREQARAKLARRALEVMAKSREEVTRAPDDAVMPDPEVLADDLTELLLSARPEDGAS